MKTKLVNRVFFFVLALSPFRSETWRLFQ